MGELICLVCGCSVSLPEPAVGTCANCYNHMQPATVTDSGTAPTTKESEDGK